MFFYENLKIDVVKILDRDILLPVPSTDHVSMERNRSNHQGRHVAVDESRRCGGRREHAAKAHESKTRRICSIRTRCPIERRLFF